MGKDLIHDNEDGDGPPINEVLEVTFLRIKTYNYLVIHRWKSPVFKACVII